MSAGAVSKLVSSWEQLTFAQVARVIVREPEDILQITLQGYRRDDEGNYWLDHGDRMIESCRTQDIPLEERWRASVVYRHFFGFTTEGVYFQACDGDGLDEDTLRPPAEWQSPSGIYLRPEVGSTIFGVVEHTARGKRFKWWAEATPEIRFFMHIVRYGTMLTEMDLASRLLSKQWEDKLWALARLLLFDNVQVFVDEVNGIRSPHPCFGKEYAEGDFPGHSRRHKVVWDGMSLRKNPDIFVHEAAMNFSEPAWWKDFQRLAEEQGVKCCHDKGRCRACFDTVNPYW